MMRLIIDVRLLEDWAQKEYGSSLGTPMPLLPSTGNADLDAAAKTRFRPVVRQVKLDASDPRLEELRARLARSGPGRPVLRGAVIVSREYEPDELAAAECYQLLFSEIFEPCGEDLGTVYDDSNACPKCGAGSVQRSNLRLDLTCIPKGADLAITIGRNERVISDRLATLMARNQITGYRLQPIEHIGTPTAEQRWHQLIITGDAGQTVPPTRFGIDYFTDDPDGKYTCPTHMLSGLHVLSEVFVCRQSLGAVDFACTNNRTGIKNGLLEPSPMILMSKRLCELFDGNCVQGFNVEVAHVV